MKSILFYVGVFFLLGSIHKIHSQRTRAALVLKDSTVLKGLGKINSVGLVKFRTTRKDKPSYYTFDQLQTVTLYEGDGIHTYVHKKIKNKSEPKILRIAKQGKVSLYKLVNERYNYAPAINSGGNFGGAGFGGFGSHYSIKHYYIQKENEDAATYLGSTSIFSKNFKKAALQYFADCPVLIEKIQNNEYKKRDITAIVGFYNKNCE